MQVEFIASLQGWFNTQKSTNIIQGINRLEKKNHTILSVGTEKAFGIIQNTICGLKKHNSCKKWKWKGTSSTWLRAAAKIPQLLSYLMVPDWMPAPKIRNRAGCPLSSLVFLLVDEKATAIRQEKNKRHTDLKERNKTSSIWRWYDSLRRKSQGIYQNNSNKRKPSWN